MDGKAKFSTRGSGALLWSLFTIVTALSALLKLSTIGMTVSIERDWVTVIAEQDSDRLNQLNTWLRRVDLISALVAPLFVSLLTTVETYAFTAAFLLGFSVATMAIEWFCKLLQIGQLSESTVLLC
jgi:iron-regulated transporter 1